MVGEKDKSVNIYKREYTSGRSGRERNPSRTDSSSSSDSARGGDSGSGNANGSAPTLDLTIPMLPTMRRHLTGGTLRQDQDFGSADEETKCNQCDKTFAKNSNLKTHIRRFHKDPENIFKCNKAGCKAAFKHRWDLDSHNRTQHLGLKVLCPFCAKPFSKKSNLYNHRNRNKGCPEETKARLQGTQGSVGAKLELDPNWTPPEDADWVPPGSHIENGGPHHSQNNGNPEFSEHVGMERGPNGAVPTSPASAAHKVSSEGDASPSPPPVIDSGVQAESKMGTEKATPEYLDDIYHTATANKEGKRETNGNSGQPQTGIGIVKDDFEDLSDNDSDLVIDEPEEDVEEMERDKEEENMEFNEDLRPSLPSVTFLADQRALLQPKVDQRRSPELVIQAKPTASSGGVGNGQVGGSNGFGLISRGGLACVRNGGGGQIPTSFGGSGSLDAEIGRGRVILTAASSNSGFHETRAQVKQDLTQAHSTGSSAQDNSNAYNPETTAVGNLDILATVASMNRDEMEVVREKSSSPEQVHQKGELLRGLLQAGSQSSQERQRSRQLSKSCAADLPVPKRYIVTKDQRSDGVRGFSQGCDVGGAYSASKPGTISSGVNEAPINLSWTNVHSQMSMLTQPQFGRVMLQRHEADLGPVGTLAEAESRGGPAVSLQPLKMETRVIQSINGHMDNQTNGSNIGNNGYPNTATVLNGKMRSPPLAEVGQAPCGYVGLAGGHIQVVGPTNGQMVASRVMMVPAGVLPTTQPQVIVVQSNGGQIVHTGSTTGYQLMSNPKLGSLNGQTLLPLKPLQMSSSSFSPVATITSPVSPRLLTVPTTKTNNSTTSSTSDLGSVSPRPKRPLQPSNSPTRNSEEELSGNEDEQSNSSTSISPSTSTVHSPPVSRPVQPQCNHCNRIFTDQAHLRTHIQAVHSDRAKRVRREKTIPCGRPGCESMFGRESHRVEHIKTVHDGHKRVYKQSKCKYCGQVFARDASLNQHISMAHLEKAKLEAEAKAKAKAEKKDNGV